jgi:hypothetical protein
VDDVKVNVKYEIKCKNRNIDGEKDRLSDEDLWRYKKGSVTTSDNVSELSLYLHLVLSKTLLSTVKTKSNVSKDQVCFMSFPKSASQEVLS